MSALENLLMMHVRAVGHTHTAIRIATEANALLVVDSQIQAQQIRSENPKLKVISVAQLGDPASVAGYRVPIVVDHQALRSLLAIEAKRREELQYRINEINWWLSKQAVELAQLKDERDGLAKRVERLQRRKKK